MVRAVWGLSVMMVVGGADFKVIANQRIVSTSDSVRYMDIKQLRYIEEWADYVMFMKILGEGGYISEIKMVFTAPEVGGVMHSHVEATIRNATGGLTPNEIQILLNQRLQLDPHAEDTMFLESAAAVVVVAKENIDANNNKNSDACVIKPYPIIMTAVVVLGIYRGFV